MSSSTTILEAVQLFATTSTDTFYIIHANQVIGHLSYPHLFDPVGRLAFLALALEIEDQALRLCQHPPFREDAWQSISDGRRCKAIELFRHRYGREPIQPREIDRLIDCTQPKDKATMIWKAKLVSPALSSSLLRFFEDLRKLRDQCVHPNRSRSNACLISQKILARFIDDANSMKNMLDEALLNYSVSRQHVNLIQL